MTHKESAYTLLLCIILAGLILLLCGCEFQGEGYSQGCLNARKELAEREWNKEVQRGYNDYMIIHNREAK